MHQRHPAGTHLYRYFGIDIARPHVPNVERWYRALQERPAYRAYVMVPFGKLYGRLEYWFIGHARQNSRARFVEVTTPPPAAR